MSDEIVTDRLQPYRQPMVTGTGIILGFVLNFAGSFVKGESGVSERASYVVFALLVVGVGSLIAALARSLRLGVPPEDQISWYQTTRVLFVVGVCSAIGAALLDMGSTFYAAE